ncbi:TetR/AcrR family transcriptional regulator [Cupriavidus sp. CuC1]|uniref:TetR/AcrR family transcriptional regulator n=1 Tax=Cupriavidus sp. CuC1 TaxID=3373131 RepID=UPI0037D87A32
MRAVDAFWRYGYEALPANTLADEMGLSKSSLYNTFGSKRQLLLEAIDAYAKAKVRAIREASDAPKLREHLRRLLLDIVKDNDGGRGCLLVNTSIELCLHDPEVRRAVWDGFQSIKTAFESLFIAGRQSAQLKRDADPAASAMTLITGIAGLRVLAKAGYTERQLSPVVDNLVMCIAV